MDIPISLHPFEIGRHLQNFFQGFVSDFDLRFPEARKRRALELSLAAPTEDKALFEGLILDFQEAKQAVSILDWPLVLEWNERWQQAKLIADLKTHLKGSPNAEALEQNLLQRLKEIYSVASTESLSEEPSLFALLRFRWKFASLREEVGYLIQRLKAFRQT